MLQLGLFYLYHEFLWIHVIYLPVYFRGFVMYHIIASYASDLIMKGVGKITFTKSYQDTTKHEPYT